MLLSGCNYMEKAIKTYILIDPETGLESEITEDQLILDNAADKKYREFYMIFAGIGQMNLDKELNGTDWSVFNFLCVNMDGNGWCDIIQQSIADQLNRPRPNICDAIKKLISKGYVIKEKHPKSGRLTLRIPPELAGKGKWAVRRARTAIEKKIKKLPIVVK